MSWLDTLEQIRTRDFRTATRAERERAARDVVNMTSYACAVVSISPLPFSDALLMLPIQTAMVMTVGHVYGRRLDQAEAKDLILEMTAVAGASFLARQGIKALLPVVGALLTVPAAFAANWAMGRVAMEYFKNPGMSRDDLRDVYRRAKEEGSGQFSKSAFDQFRKKHEAGIQDVAKEPPAPASAPAPPPAEAPRKKGKTIGRAERPRSASASKAPAAAAAKKSIGRKKKAGEAEAARSPVREVVEVQVPKKIQANRDAAARIGGLVHLDLSGAEGGQWTVDLAKVDHPVSRGLRGRPKLTVKAEDQFFLKLVQGKADPQVAVFTGKLKLEPMDVELATSVAKILTA
jgi:uncharacterized protein (DUF697 family)/putative sterol carrier protein